MPTPGIRVVIAHCLRQIANGEEGGLSQAEIGKRAKMKQNVVSSTLNARRPINEAHVDGILDALGIDVRALAAAMVLAAGRSERELMADVPEKRTRSAKKHVERSPRANEVAAKKKQQRQKEQPSAPPSPARKSP